MLACGANYAFQRRFGFGLPRTYLHTAQRELPCRRIADVELHFGQLAAPGGFAWAVPVVRPDGPYVRVGVMASRDVVGCYARMLERIAGRCGVTNLDLPPRQKILPLGAIDRTFGDRMLAIGDAAGLVKPPTAAASTTALSAPRSPPMSPSTRWPGTVSMPRPCPRTSGPGARSSRENSPRAARAARRRAPSGVIRRSTSFFELAHTDGIMPIVRATARFNEHRPLIRAKSSAPAARRILFRAIVA